MCSGFICDMDHLLKVGSETVGIYQGSQIEGVRYT